MNLQEFTEPFYVSRVAQGCHSTTVKYYRDHIGAFFAWCATNGYEGNDLVGTTGAETVESYAESMRGRGLSPFTVHNTFRALRCYCKWVWKRHKPEDESPFVYLKMPATPDLLPKSISYSQMLLLHHSIKSDRSDWVTARDKLLIKTLFFTGLRAGELITLSLADVDIAQRRLRVRRWKTDREQFIPLTKSLAGDIGQWIAEQRPPVGHDGLWPSYLHLAKVAGPPMTVDSLKHMLMRRCKAAGLPKFLAHSFRHGTAVEIIARGGALNLISELLGHTQISSTMRYLRYDISRTATALDRIFD